VPLDILCGRTNEGTQGTENYKDGYSKQVQQINPEECSAALRSLAIATLVELFD
jgi:hypothetical protein